MDAGLDTAGIMVGFLVAFNFGIVSLPMIYFIFLGAWKSILSTPDTLHHNICPGHVVSGKGWNSIAGTCARTWSTSYNKLISYVCDGSLYSYAYICQKPKQRM